MWEGTERALVAAPPDRVWAVITDVGGHADLAGSGEIGAVRLHAPVAFGSTWEADIRVPGLDEPFVSRSEVVVFNAPTEFAWTSEPRPIVPGDPRSVPEVTWWFRLAAGADGTTVEHTFRVVEPEVAADQLTEFFERTNRVESLRAGMRPTLENIKARADV
ncbi:MAG TPA: SRPBCC family protein [Acidimicrobiia bacterium]|nr:SRPBCC family protein [Acidimicrobiia bacterium]